MLVKPIKPKCLYLYRYASNENLDWLKPILLQNQLYFPSPSELNDPAEGKPKPSRVSASSIAQFLCDQFVAKRPNLSPAVYDSIKHDITDEVHSLGCEQILGHISKYLNSYLNRNKIYSLCKRWDNMSMWAKYAGNHTGYCLEFKNSGLFSRAYEVYYSDEEITQDFTNLNKVNGYFFFCKKSEWSNEEEVRIVTSSSMPNPMPFDPTLLSRVILGYKISTEDKSQIVQWTKKRSIPLPIAQSRYDEFNHALELIHIC